MTSLRNPATDTASDVVSDSRERLPESVSLTDDAAEQQRQAVELRQMLDEMEARSGPIPPDVRDRIRALPWPD